MNQLWMKEQLIGFSVKSFQELLRVIGLGVNMVEIKPEKFFERGMPLYDFDGFDFHVRWENLQKIRDAVAGISVQFHAPFERNFKGEIEDDKELNMALLEHHDLLLKRFAMFEHIFQRFHLGQILTVHPPLYSKNGREIIPLETALQNAKIFFERLDKLRLEKDWQTLIGVENQTDPKLKGGNLGYFPKHFKKMLIDTRTIGLTLDTGHRRLTKKFTTRGFMSIGFEVVNCHFHGNNGEFRIDDWKDDQHQLPCKENFVSALAFINHLRYFRRFRTPIVLEISNLEKYSDFELLAFVENLKYELK